MYEIFEQLLQKHGLTTYKIAKETGISQTIFSNWKSGRSVPKQDKLILIANYFNVTIDFLTGNTKQIFCHDCGAWHNPLDVNNEKNHAEYHTRWAKAVEKYGFCWNYIRSSERERVSMEVINNKEPSRDVLIMAFENLFMAQFSDLLRENGFDLNLDYNSFCAKQIFYFSVRYNNKMPDEIYEFFRKKYGLEWDLGMDTISFEDTVSTGVRVKVFEQLDLSMSLDENINIVGEEHISYGAALFGNLYGIKIKGDSMEPRICNNDIVIFREQNNANNGDIVLINVNNDALCRQYVKYADGVRLIPYNPACEPLYFTNEEIKNLPITIIGKVIENRQKY